MKKVIEFEQVDFAFEQAIILENITIAIEKNDFVGVIGPNGGGKTTFLKIIMGFLEPIRGSVRVFGEEAKKNRTRIGYVPQNAPYDRSFPMTVLDLVLSGGIKHSKWFGRYPQDVRKRANELLEELEITEHKYKHYGELSGGLAQRALIARALMDDPEILLLDEPTANVDLTAQKKIFDIIFSFKGKKTILMVTHDLNTVINNIGKIFCVEKRVSSLLPNQVCEHFALGLYHAPLKGEDHD